MTKPKFNVGDVIIEETSKDRIITAVGVVYYLYQIKDQEGEYCDFIEKIDRYYSLKPQEITITKEQLKEAWIETACNNTANFVNFDGIAKRLGFKDE